MCSMTSFPKVAHSDFAKSFLVINILVTNFMSILKLETYLPLRKNFGVIQLRILMLGDLKLLF